MTRAAGGPEPAYPVAVATTVTMLGALPVFLVGAYSTAIRLELGLSLLVLGMASAAYRGTGGLAARPAGSAIDRIGGPSGIALALAMTAVSSCLVAAVATNQYVLLLAVGLSGASAVTGQIAGTALLAGGRASARLGRALAVQLSALPLAAGVAGGLVEILGAGAWRTAFAAHAMVAAAGGCVFWTRRWQSGPARPEPGGRIPRALQLRLSAALGLGMLSAACLPIFIVETLSSVGIDPEIGGRMLVVGSGLTIATRVCVGHAADAGRSPLTVAMWLLVGGSMGYFLLSTGGRMASVAGAAVAFGLGWGFVHLVILAAVRLRTDSVGAAVGATIPGGLFGGLVGPVAFGALADRAGLQVAWMVAAFAAVVAALAVLECRRAVERHATDTETTASWT